MEAFRDGLTATGLATLRSDGKTQIREAAALHVYGGGLGKPASETVVTPPPPPPPPPQTDQYDPFIVGLLKKLPTANEPWAVEGRVKWLKTAAHAFDLIYGDTGEITINPPKKEEEKKQGDI